MRLRSATDPQGAAGKVADRVDIGRRLRAVPSLTSPSVLTRLAMSDAVLDSIDVGIIACDRDGRLTVFNRVAREFHGLDADGSVDQQHLAERFSLFRPDGSTLLCADEIPLLRVLTEGEVHDEEIVIAPTDKPSRLVSCTGRVITSEAGAVTGAVIALRDITAHRAAQHALAGSERMFRTAFQDSPVGQALVDSAGRGVEVNPALCQMLGRSVIDLVPRPVSELVPPADLADADRMVRPVLEGRSPNATFQTRLLHESGRSIWTEVVVSGVAGPDGASLYLLQVQDITARRHAEETLREQALRDPLTGLPNRSLLAERVEEALARLDRRDRRLAVMFIDLDGFKSVNEEHGHDGGDTLLVQAGRRLRSVLRGNDTVARLGGDEFVVVCADLPAASHASAFEMAARILAELRRPFTIADAQVRLSASVGIAFAEEPGATAADLISRADLAMYSAKTSGKGRYSTYAADTTAAGLAASRAEGLVRRALDGDRLVVHYQPLFDLRSRTVIGVEALARIYDDEGRLVSPEEFVPVAERCGMIGRLGEMVLRQALPQVVAWKTGLEAGREFGVGVNLSVRQLGEPGLVARVASALADSGLDPDALCLELTESVFSDADEHIEVVQELRRLGPKLVIDDFGTGYSSLSYLRRFPVDGLKIDRSFVADLVHHERDRRVTNAIVRMALDLGMPVIAEGIETDEQLAELQSLDCPLGQGYLLSRPLTAAAMTALLASSA